MISMSELLRKIKEKKRKAQEERQKGPFIEPACQEAPLEPVKPAEVKEQKAENAQISEIRISPLVMKEAKKTASSAESLELYAAFMALMREVLKENVNHTSINVNQITQLVEKTIEQLSLDKENLLGLAIIKDSKDENYLLSHSINICIFSIVMGLCLGYEKSKLVELGISALLHDIGMPDYLYLSNQARKLTALEYSEIKKHSMKGSEILGKVDNLPKIASYVALQHHERIDGSGYPQGLKKESIYDCAKIVNILDVFEAMIHLRAYRNEFLPFEALEEIITNKNTFEYRLIKAVMEKIGVFPIESLVELNTREIAQVIKLNLAAPMRPVVKIIYELDSEEPKEEKILDLTIHPNISIKKAVRKSDLKTLLIQ